MTAETGPARDKEASGAAKGVNPIRAGFHTITPYLVVKARRIC